MSRRASLIVLNYNGADLLSRCLPSVVKAACYNGASNEVIVIDNASSDNSLNILKESFPGVKVIPMVENGFLFSYNRVIPACTTEYVILLNNDMIVEEDFIPPLLEHFVDSRVFAVMPRINAQNPQDAYLCRRKASWVRGMLNAPRDTEYSGPGVTLYAHGGASAYDRLKFQELGGFDPLFWPFYGEDDDLSYRAWMRGYRILYEPKSRVFHLGSISTGSYLGSALRKEQALEAASLTRDLKNASDRILALQCIVYAAARLTRAVLTLDYKRLGAFKMVAAKLPLIRHSRRVVRKFRIVSDREIVRMLEMPVGSALPRVVLIVPKVGESQTGGECYIQEVWKHLRAKANVQVIQAQEFPRWAKTGHLRRNLWVFWRLLKLNPDVVIVESYMRPAAFLAVRLLKTFRAFKYVAFVQDLYRPEGIGYHRRRLSEWIIKMYLGAADAVITNSRYMRSEIKRLGCRFDRIWAISPPPWHRDRLCSEMGRTDNGTPIILCVANLRHLKGQDILIEALSGLREKPWEAHLVGGVKDRQYDEALRRLVKVKGLDDKVSFLGHLTGQDLEDEYRRASLFVLPSRYEAHGMVIEEAMSYGLPVVASEVGGIPEMVQSGKNGFLFKSGDPETLRTTLIELLENEPLRRVLGENAKKQAGQASTWEEVCKAFSNVVNGVMFEGAVHEEITVVRSLANFKAYFLTPLTLSAASKVLHRNHKRALRFLSSAYEGGKAIRILLVRPAYIGDIVTFLPAIRSVREAFPKAQLSLMASRMGEEIVRGEGLVDEVLECSYADISSLSWPGKIALGLKLRKRRFDFVVLSAQETQLDLAVISALTGARLICGPKESEGSFLFHVAVETDESKMEVERNLDLLRSVGVRVRSQFPTLKVTDNEKEMIAEFLALAGVRPEVGFVVLSPFGKRATRNWLLEQYVSLIDYIRNQYGFELVLVGGSKDKTGLETIARQVKHPVRIFSDLSLRELMALIARAALLVSVDSGPVHLAKALGTPTIALFGPGDLRKWGYVGPGYAAVRKPVLCSPCYFESCASHDCMIALSPEMVEDAISNVLSAQPCMELSKVVALT